MSDSPFSYIEGLHIGTVDSVAPNEIKVLLDIKAPESVALNAGGVLPFPRVNRYVLIPVDDGHLVGQIEWVTIQRSDFPKRKGMQDFGLIDLPYPLRKINLNPVGTLWQEGKSDYIFRRGANTMPSVGAPALLPTNAQMVAIVQSGSEQRVNIGTSPLAADATVWVDPDRLFGRHLAVLGNTGSGKSCSVAGIIRWSLEAALEAVPENSNKGIPQARFIVLDPNGEYSKVFSTPGLGVDVQVLSPNSKDEKSRLKVPLWFWNSEEWSSFTHASAGTQRPLLKRALREIKSGKKTTWKSEEEEKKFRARICLSSTLILIRNSVIEAKIKKSAFGHELEAIKADIEDYQKDIPAPFYTEICCAIDNAFKNKRYTFPGSDGETVVAFRPFKEREIRPVVETIEKTLDKLGGILYQAGPDEDIPRPFKGSDLADHLEFLAKQDRTTQYVEFLVSRIRTLLADSRIAPIIEGVKEPEFLQDWLKNYLGDRNASQGKITVLDLSLVPTEIVHVITAVVARMIFSALQRHRKLTDKILPTVLVAEEAHTFIRRYKDDSENQSAASVCCQVFERIAREGRKHGLGLILSSQRPSELSPTVLSQCNTFLLHRISSDPDQDLVKKLLPDNLRGLLDELPLLPSQQAILLGWASELPLLVKMRNLPEEQRPLSDDPDYWNVWTKPTKSREPNWQRITKDWQGPRDPEKENGGGTNAGPPADPDPDPDPAATKPDDFDDDMPF